MIRSNQQKISRFFAAIAVFSILFGNLSYAAKARDIGQPDELSLGSSVFIFRGSSKKAQFTSTSPMYFQRSLASRKLNSIKDSGKKIVAVNRKKSAKSAKPKIKKPTAKNSIRRKKQKPPLVSVARKSAAPDPVAMAFDRAVENYNRGNYAEAVAGYKQVVALDAAHPDAHANLASSYRQLERYAEANAEYKLAHEFIKDDAEMFSEWGYCLGKVDEWGKAVSRLLTAKELTPDAIDFGNLGWAYLNAAQKDTSLANQTAARDNLSLGKESLRQAVEMNPQLAAALLNLGIVYNELGEHENAVEILKKANDLRQNWLVAINELGTAYLKSNDFSAAIDQFQKATILDDDFAPGYFNLGEAQYRFGRKKDAKKTLEKLRQLNPDAAERLNQKLKGR